MIKPRYTSDELKYREDSEEERKRLRGIFEEIKQRVKAGKPVAVSEREFFCRSLSMLQEEPVCTYSVCDDWRFKYLFYRYWHDLEGKGNHGYVQGVGIVKPSRTQIETELKELQEFADKWFLTVKDTSIAEGGLKDAAKETRDELKDLDKEPEFNEQGVLNQNSRYERSKLALLLRLKFAYLISEEVFATQGVDEITFTLNGKQLVFNKYSCIHIINRHYAKDQKVVNRNKSFHEKIVPPRDLPNILGGIIRSIENSGLYTGQDHMKIYLRYKGFDFALWSEVKYKQQKGSKGNIPFNRIQTFYPIELESDLTTIQTDYVLTEIDSKLSVYINKNSVHNKIDLD